MIRLISCALLLSPLLLRSHPISLSWAHARISGDKITINFKVLAEDLVYFHQPEHDEYYNYDVASLRDLAKKHAELVLRYFFITDNTDEILASEIVSINDQSLKDDTEINVMDLMKYEIQFKIEYTLIDKDWKNLIFHQEFGRHGIGIPSVTFLSVYSNDKPLIENIEVSPGNSFNLKPSLNEVSQNPSELNQLIFHYFSKGSQA